MRTGTDECFCLHPICLRASRYESGIKGGDPAIADLRDQVKRLTEDTERAKYAVDRLSGQTFWKEPSAGWLKKDGEIKSIEAMLVMSSS